jgi:hypothetical protein
VVTRKNKYLAGHTLWLWFLGFDAKLTSTADWVI